MSEENKKTSTEKYNKVKKGEELIAVLKEGLADHSKIIENQEAIIQKLDSLGDMVRRALPPSPGKFTRC